MRRALIALLIALIVLSIVVQVFDPALVSSNSHSSLPLIYVSPSRGALYVSPTTSLAFRQGSPLSTQDLKPDFFSIIGGKSGVHSGTVHLSDDLLTILFYPDKPFSFNETVSVVVKPGLVTADGGSIASANYQFSTVDHLIPISALSAPPPAPSTAHPQPAPPTPTPEPAPSPYHTYPEFSNIMTRTVTTAARDTGDGYIFVASIGGAQSTFVPALFILDNNAQPIYIKTLPNGMLVTDFDQQVVHGTPYLSYFAGTSANAWAYGSWYVMDNTYTVVNVWTVSNSYGADLHEFRLLDNGHALLESYVPIPADLTAYGGPANGIVVDSVIQEQDSQKNVVFEWHASQHISLADSYYALYASPVDFMHTNALALDGDGNLLISSRHLSQIIKVNRQTGAIMWRLGGKNNQFKITNDIGFSYQHNLRRLPNGDLTLFDNGNQHVPPHSRAIEYAIDETAKTLTRVWEYPTDNSIYSSYMGSVQRLSNGNTFIGWGAIAQATELLPDNSKAFEMSMGDISYRAFRYTWQAAPADLPRAAVISGANPTTATVFSSWNGATQATGYAIYGGPTTSAMSLITTTARTGFETATPLTGLDPTTCVFQIRPIQPQGQPAPFSDPVYRLGLPGCQQP